MARRRSRGGPVGGAPASWDIVGELTVEGTRFKVTAAGKAKVEKSPKGIPMPGNPFTLPSAHAPKMRKDKDVAAYIWRA